MWQGLEVTAAENEVGRGLGYWGLSDRGCLRGSEHVQGIALPRPGGENREPEEAEGRGPGSGDHRAFHGGGGPAAAL